MQTRGPIRQSEDAAVAVQHGVDVIWVSNHGGRQLDHGLGSLDTLPKIVQAVNGEARIIVDGGVQRGSDILQEGGRLVALETGLSDTQYTDSAATRLTARPYQVAAVVNGGEASRSRQLAICDFSIANAPASLVIRALRGPDRSMLYDSTTHNDLFDFTLATLDLVRATDTLVYRDSMITLQPEEDDSVSLTIDGIHSLIVFGDDGSFESFNGAFPDDITGAAGSLYLFEDEALLSQNNDLDDQESNAMRWIQGGGNCPEP
ncbi:L-lactate dehydrogenase [Candidatus Entotheonellaceae bacterium PAL068K]